MQAGPAIQPTPPISITAAGICAEAENTFRGAAVHDRQQPPGVGGGVLDGVNARVLGEPRDDVEGKVAALELRIGVEHHRNVDRVGDGAEVGFDLRILEWKIGFEDGEDAVGAERLIVHGLCDASAVDVEATPATTGTRWRWLRPSS